MLIKLTDDLYVNPYKIRAIFKNMDENLTENISILLDTTDIPIIVNICEWAQICLKIDAWIKQLNEAPYLPYNPAEYTATETLC